jgi:hypothetical protein
MERHPIFGGEAEYERWLNSTLEAERQRLRLQLAPDKKDGAIKICERNADAAKEIHHDPA